MSEPLEFTGERFTPESVREIWYEHLHRYVLAAGLVKGLKVLDAACGEGYGSDLLARTAAHVTGVDVSESAIRHARQRYENAAQGRLQFSQSDVTGLPFDDDSFDAIVSFETLEHLDSQKQMLAEFRRVLKPHGWLLISTPDRTEYNRHAAEPNPWHVRELEKDDFTSLLETRFPARRLLGQKLVFQSAIWTTDAPQRCHPQSCSDDNSLATGWPYPPVYWLALCAEQDRLLPAMDNELYLFGDAGESVYAHYYHEIRKNMQAGTLLAEREAEIERLRQQLETQSQTATRQPFWRRWFR